MVTTSRKPKVSKIQPISSIATPSAPTHTTLEETECAADIPLVAPQPTPQHNVILCLKCTQRDLLPQTMSFFTAPVLGSNNVRIEDKLKQLETQLHTNSCENKQGACFWCTCNFTATPVHIPKYIMNGTYHVYGRFCSPECAAGYLMNSDIDSSSKFNSYALLNSLYNNIFGYSTSIRPAPNPHYLLDKFCGNLTIEEYRNIHNITSKHLFIVDKPLVKLMPELHQDIGDMLLYNKLLSQDVITSTLHPGMQHIPVPPPPPKNSSKSAFKALFTKQPADGITLL
jgi:hypothetical protein